MTTDEEPTLPKGNGEPDRSPTPDPSAPSPALSAELLAGRGKGGGQDLRRSETSGESEEASRAVTPFPSGREVGGGGLRLLHVLTLLALFSLWTWKLLEQQPVPEAISAQLTDDMKFGAAKSLHAIGYGFLTLLAVTLPVPNYWRWFFVGLLALHGVTTEIAQTYIPGRTGRVMDVVIDWAGIALGVLIWRVWPAPRSEQEGTR